MNGIHITVEEADNKVVGICIAKDNKIIKMCLDEEAQKLYDELMDILLR